MLAYLPRFFIAVVAVPLVFVAVAFIAVRTGAQPQTPAALVAAIAFSAVALAPSTKNAALRAGLLAGLASIAALVTFLAIAAPA